MSTIHKAILEMIKWIQVMPLICVIKRENEPFKWIYGGTSVLQIITLMQIKTMRLHFIATAQMISFKITIAKKK